jgi:hypothetical protein
MDIKTSINKIIESYEKIIINIEDIFSKLSVIFNEKSDILITNISKNIKNFKNVLSQINDNIENIFILINNIELCSLIIENIQIDLKKVLNKTEISETYLSQTFINETYIIHKNIMNTINNINKLKYIEKNKIIEYFVNLEIDKIEQENILNYIKKIQILFYKNPHSIDLYCHLILTILNKVKELFPNDKILYYKIIKIIEDDKTYILSLINNEIPTISKSVELNPYYKNFNLIPLTDLLPINEISNILFNQSLNMKEFIKLCKNKDYSIIIIKKHTKNPISFKTNQLLDWKKYQEFSKLHKRNYGIDKHILSYYSIIEQVDVDSKWDFSIETHGLKFNNFEEDMNNYTIILDSLAPNLYRIEANYLSSHNYFVKIGSIKELYDYCKNKKPSRIGSFNALNIKKAKNILFSPIKHDLDKIKEVSTIVDPKYIRNEIYLLMLDEFNLFLKKNKNIKDNYTYASIIHDNKFLEIYSDVLVREFYSYLYKNYSDYVNGNIQISEIISSFMNVIYINQRIFVKEIHDYFKDNLFDFTQDNVLINLKIHFDEMIRYVLDKIITIDNNIYQMILYKINLLKTTLI